MSNEKMELLLEELNSRKEKREVQKNTFGNIPTGSLFIGMLLFSAMAKKETNFLKLTDDPKDKYYKVSKINHLVKDLVPYFDYNGRSMLANIESVLNIAENLYGIGSGINKNKAYSMGKIYHPKKHLKLLETVSPYLEGKGRENTEKLLKLNYMLERLQYNNKKDILKSGQDVIEILDLLNIKKAQELKQNINTMKTIASLLTKN
mgnify:CR=1 FL=1